MNKLVSPNALFEEAQKEMLFGNKPITPEDWVLVFNFFAARIDPRAQPAALLVLRMIYDAPLTESTVCAISKFQVERKGK